LLCQQAQQRKTYHTAQNSRYAATPVQINILKILKIKQKI
jgi:hypothetical protein